MSNIAPAYTGFNTVSLTEFCAQFAALGYIVDRTMDCKGTARIMTGEHAGETYPCCTTGLYERDTGLSAFHVAARRDDNYRAMQQLRKDICAMVKGYVLEV